MKKKLLAILLCIAMLAIAVVGGTMAYFTDTKTQTNTFTAGNVAITLDEAKLVMEDNEIVFDDDGNPTYSGRTSDPQTYQLFPGMEVKKDPTITLTSGSEDAYIAAIITVTFDKDASLEVLRKNNIVMEKHLDMLMADTLLEGDYIGQVGQKTHPLSGKNNMLVYGDTRYSVYQIPDAANRTYKIYMFFENVQEAGATITPFDTITIPASWDNDDMAAVNGLKIDIAAYAVQAHGFENAEYPCYEAMVAAFGQNAGDPFKLT